MVKMGMTYETGIHIFRRKADLGQNRLGVDIRRAQQHFERTGGAAPLGQQRAFQHHRPGIGPGHGQIGGIGAGIDPGPLVQGPAKAGGGLRLPALHGNDLIVDLQAIVVDEPVAQFAQGHAVAHGHGAGPDKAFPAGDQAHPFHRTTSGVGAIQDPDGLAVFGRRLQHIEQGGDEGIDPAAQVLQVDQDDVEGLHGRCRGAADLAIKAEDRQPCFLVL